MWLGPPLRERGNRVTERLAGPAQSPAAHPRPPPPPQMPVLCSAHKPLLLPGPPERPPPATPPAQRVSKLFSEHFEVSWAPPPVPQIWLPCLGLPWRVVDTSPSPHPWC